MRGKRTEATILAHRRNRGIVFGSDEADVVKLERMNIDGFLYQIAILVADVLKLGRWNADVKSAARCMTVACGFQPGLKRLTSDLFF